METEILRILQDKTGIPIGTKTAHEYLKDGIVLCNYINTITHSTMIPKISTKSLPFLQMENILNFLNASRDFVSSNDLFELFELFEAKDLGRVYHTVSCLEKICKNGVPVIKSKSSTVNSPKELVRSSSAGSGSNSPFRSRSLRFSAASNLIKVQPPPEPEIIIEPDFADKAKQDQLESNIKAVRQFIESRVGEVSGTDLKSILRDGVVLCNLINTIKPNAVLNVHNSKALPFLQMENIHGFLEVCKSLGVQDHELFQTTDLYEGRDMQQVVVTLLALMRIAGFTHRTPKKSFTSSSLAESDISSMNSPTTKSISALHISDDVSISSSRLDEPKIHRKKSKHKGSKKGTKMKLSSDYDLTEQAINTKIVMHSNAADEEPVEFQLGDCIGRGHFGAVHKGLNLNTGEIVAIKRIRLNEDNIKELATMMKEVELLKSLDHTNIVKYEGFVQTNGYLNIILEFVENGSLYHTLKQFGAFPEKLVSYYAVGILEGLHYLHTRNVIHCDLKAANILSTKTGTIKLSDFGVSKEFSFDVTDTSVAGTPNWMAPEIIELKGATVESDIWSFGCTLIELITGKPPYADCNPMTVLFRIVEDDRPPIPENISQELREILLQCFMKDEKKRPPAKELLLSPWVNSAKKRVNTVKHSHDSRSTREMSPIPAIPEDFRSSIATTTSKELSFTPTTVSSLENVKDILLSPHVTKTKERDDQAANTPTAQPRKEIRPVDVKITTESLSDVVETPTITPLPLIKSNSELNLQKKASIKKDNKNRKMSFAKSEDCLSTNAPSTVKTTKSAKLRRKSKAKGSGEKECIIC